MSKAKARIAPIMSDYQTALSTLLETLNHIAATKPEPALRVVFLNSAIVSLVSLSEETMRSMFKEYLLVVQEDISDPSLLRVALQKSNYSCGINALKGLSIPGANKQAGDTILKINAFLNGAAGYALFHEELTFNRGNFRSAQITEIAKNCGIDEILKNIFDCEDFQNLLGEDDLARRSTMAITRWNEVFDERDIVVHRISQASGWADGRIRDAVRYFDLFVRRLSECLIVDADGLISKATAIATRKS